MIVIFQILKLLKNDNITNEGIKRFSCLTILNLTYNTKITDDGIKPLSSLNIFKIDGK
jgi:hypothetical protein